MNQVTIEAASLESHDFGEDKNEEYRPAEEPEISCDEIIDVIQNTQIKKINKDELSWIVKFVYFLGMQRIEITKLKWKDLVDSQGNLKESIELKKPIPLDQSRKDLLHEFIRQNPPNLNNMEELVFKKYKQNKTLTNHLQIITKAYNTIY
jgi:integrase